MVSIAYGQQYCSENVCKSLIQLRINVLVQQCEHDLSIIVESRLYGVEYGVVYGVNSQETKLLQ